MENRNIETRIDMTVAKLEARLELVLMHAEFAKVSGLIGNSAFCCEI